MNFTPSLRSLLPKQFGILKSLRNFKSKNPVESKSDAASLVADDAIYVPRTPVPSPINQNEVEESPVFDKVLITHLERLSLVRFSDEQAVFNLKQAVRYANLLKLVDTAGVEPLETLLEDVPCPLREDIVGNPMAKEEVLMNAAETAEDYFVTPPGNVPLEESDRLDLAKVEDWDRRAMKNRVR